MDSTLKSALKSALEFALKICPTDRKNKIK